MSLILGTYVITMITIATARPPSDIKYMHNISLTYDGKQLQNLDSIKQLSGVDDQMATALQEAIKNALPSYINEVAGNGDYALTIKPITIAKQNEVDSTNDTVNETNIPQSMSLMYSQTRIPTSKQPAITSLRGNGPPLSELKTSVHASSTVESISNNVLRNTPSGSTLSIPVSSLTPNDDFWKRDDLVHFYVNIDMIDAADSDLPPLAVDGHNTIGDKN